MFSNYEYQRIQTEYMRLIKGRQKKALKIWVPIMLVSVIFIAIVFIFTDWIKTEAGIILIPLYGGMIIVFVIVAILVSAFGYSSKPTFNYLYPEIYKKIELSESKVVNYVPFEKLKNDFVKAGGLFPGSARAQVYRHVSSKTDEGIAFNVLDTMLITGSGKNQQVHLNGLYYYFNLKSISLLQIRSNGRPHLKGHKFEKVDEGSIFKVYIEKDKRLTSDDKLYIHKLNEIKNRLNAKKVYLSITFDKVHFAYTPFKQIRKHKNLSLSKLNELYQFFLNEERLISDFNDLIIK